MRLVELVDRNRNEVGRLILLIGLTAMLIMLALRLPAASQAQTICICAPDGGAR